MTTGSSGRTWAQWFCLVGGAALLLRGTIGVALDPVFEGPGEGWHQLFHLSSGAALLALSGRARPAFVATLGFAVLYAGVTLAGIADGHDVASVIPIDGSDIAIHSLYVLAALGMAVATIRSREKRGVRRALR